MESPDHALLLKRNEGFYPPSPALTPLLSRHGIVRGKQIRKEFTDWCVRLLEAAVASRDSAPHRHWPSANGGVILALLPWKGHTEFAVHFYEEPDPTLEQLRMASLTPREMEVLTWISEGKDNASIAILMDTTLGTIKKHTQKILLKLECENRTTAARIYAKAWERYQEHTEH